MWNDKNNPIASCQYLCNHSIFYIGTCGYIDVIYMRNILLKHGRITWNTLCRSSVRSEVPMTTYTKTTVFWNMSLHSKEARLLGNFGTYVTHNMQS